MHASVQYTEAARIIVLLAAVGVVVFWRIVVKWLIVVASTAIIATLGFGLLTIWQATHHVVA